MWVITCLPPEAAVGPGEGWDVPAQPLLVAPGRIRGTRQDSRYPVSLQHGAAAPPVLHLSPAVLPPDIAKYFIRGPQIPILKMCPCIFPDGTGLSRPPGWDLSPGQMNQWRGQSCPSCWPRSAEPRRTRVGRRREGSRAPRGAQQRCGADVGAARSGFLGAQCWARSPAARMGGRKSLCCRPAGTYVCLEAPAPKLLLLICNPLRAGGKGIRGD